MQEKELRKKIYGYEVLNNTERARLWKADHFPLYKRSVKGANATAEYSSGSVGVDTKSLPEVPAISLLLARPVKGPALVICPMAAVNQWMKEIEKFTRKGTLKTLVYHGTEKGRLATQFKKCDVVITTYQTLEASYRREAHKHRVKCKYCQKLFMPEKLAFHQRYFCGPNAEKTKKQQKTAAKKAMQSMGIGNSKASSSTDAPPTITNIYRNMADESLACDFMKQAGVTVKSKGYWNAARRSTAKATSVTKTVGKAAKVEPAGKAGKRMPLLLRKGAGASKYQGVSPLKSSGKWQASYQGSAAGSFARTVAQSRESAAEARGGKRKRDEMEPEEDKYVICLHRRQSFLLEVLLQL
eukprot:Skav214919  [mRNA]  locus=scaffold2073:144857:154480:- [translate_table: standard]